MLRPKIPTMPTPTGLVTPPAVVQPSAVVQQTTVEPVQSSPAPVAQRPTVQITPGTALAVIGAGTAVVLVVGTVLVSMLLATAVTAASVAVCAVVVRSLIASSAKRR
ncbi:SpdD-like protein [Streptomyces venezuelae]|uniref:SpdD-like protein n=1 Tax=Streptomyces venezuelae TaxID=54571 RepID=UPI00123DD583|nr:SpdD-like protein [Streptomyces venezuelae]QES13853.1 SpdD-like protein [Streptomyces venezuelae]